jgi:hypothetical protein
MQRSLRRLLTITTAGALLVAGVLAASGPERPPVEVLRSDLARILARAEYRQGQTEWLHQLVIRWLRQFLQWWHDHVGRRLEGLADTAPFFYWTIVALCLGLALVLIYHIYVTMRSAFGTAPRRRRRDAEPLAWAAKTEPQGLMDDAEAAAQAGQFALALRYLYLALIHHLDRRDIVRYDVSHTNQEYLRQARAHPVLLDPLRQVTRLADRAWYGQYPLGRPEYEQCRALVEAAWQEAERAPA